MTSRELRKQRREAERKARKLEYQQNRLAAAAAEPALNHNPDLLDEFTAEEQAEMMALRARVHARAARGADSQSAASRLVGTEGAREAHEKPGPTGPRTAEGKAVSSGNSLKHGLASGRIIIAGEDPAEFEALLQSLLAEHAPATETEALLVQQMAQSWWLMQRAIRMQSEAFTGTDVDTHKLALFLRYQTTHERAFYKALNTLTKLKLTRARIAAVASPAPEFVSQERVGAVHAAPLSQKIEAAPEFVSQNQGSSGLSVCQYDVQPASVSPKAA